MTAIASGTLKHRLTFQAQTDSKDSLGAPQQVWSNTATVWGNVEPISARDYVGAQRLSNEITHLITIRASSTFAKPLDVATLQAVFGTRTFRIHGCLNVDEASVYLMLYASEQSIDAI